MKRLMKILSINLEKLWDILKQTILAIEEEWKQVNNIVQDNLTSKWNKVTLITHHKINNSNKFKITAMTKKAITNRKIKNQKKVNLFPNARKKVKFIMFNLNSNNKDGKIKAMSMKMTMKCFLNRMKKLKVN
jgi:hypothetical protein